MDVNCPAITDYLNIQQFHFIDELLKECKFVKTYYLSESFYLDVLAKTDDPQP